MATQIGITQLYGITLPEKAEPQEVRRTQTVEIAELVGRLGEYIKADPKHTKKVDLTINGVGAVDRDAVTSGLIAVPSTMTETKVETDESNSERPTFTLNASGYEAFSDPNSTPSGAGSVEPDFDILNIVSVNYALTEGTTIGTEVTDVVITATDGTPGARGKCKHKSPFSIRGRGDIPAGLALGSGGASVFGLGSGKFCVSKLEDGQKMDDFQDWNLDGAHYKEAA